MARMKLLRQYIRTVSQCICGMTAGLNSFILKAFLVILKVKDSVSFHETLSFKLKCTKKQIKLYKLERGGGNRPICIRLAFPTKHVGWKVAWTLWLCDWATRAGTALCRRPREARVSPVGLEGVTPTAVFLDITVGSLNPSAESVLAQQVRRVAHEDAKLWVHSLCVGLQCAVSKSLLIWWLSIRSWRNLLNRMGGHSCRMCKQSWNSLLLARWSEMRGKNVQYFLIECLLLKSPENPKKP